MDPKAAAKAQEAMIAFMQAMHSIELQYVNFLQRMGCKRVTLHRF